MEKGTLTSTELYKQSIHILEKIVQLFIHRIDSVELNRQILVHVIRIVVSCKSAFPDPPKSCIPEHGSGIQHRPCFHQNG